MVDEPPPRALRMTGYVVVIMLVVITLISAMVKIDVVVSGTGELAMDAPPIVLQPLERAIIRSVTVKAGDTVSKGQLLATLDATFVAADAAAHVAQRDAAASLVKRLEAESKGQPYVAATNAAGSDATQAEIHKRRAEQLASRLRAFDEDIMRLEAAKLSLEQEQALHMQQLSIAQEMEKMRSDLMELQYTSRLQMLETRNFRLRAELDWKNATGRQQELIHQLESKKAERAAFLEDWRRSSLEEYERHRTELARLNEIVSKSKRMAELVNVYAPEDAVVLEVAGRSVGSVLREAEPLLILVSAHGSLIADVAIRSSDIGFAKTGDLVRIKVDAFPYQRHGMLEGRLRSISERSYDSGVQPARMHGAPPRSEANAATHRARVEITKVDLRNLPTGARATPGMTVSAEIVVGTRSVLSYFLDPIRRGFDESMREPS